MTKLSAELIIRIIDTLEERGAPFYPVLKLAEDLGLAATSSDGDTVISGDGAAHLLHLQDLGCIQNILGKYEWGYEPLHDEDAIRVNFMMDGPWEMPNYYDLYGYGSIIRNTAEAYSVREALRSDRIDARAKLSVLNGGGKIAMALLSQLALKQAGLS